MSDILGGHNFTGDLMVSMALLSKETHLVAVGVDTLGPILSFQGEVCIIWGN